MWHKDPDFLGVFVFLNIFETNKIKLYCNGMSCEFPERPDIPENPSTPIAPMPFSSELHILLPPDAVITPDTAEGGNRNGIQEQLDASAAKIDDVRESLPGRSEPISIRNPLGEIRTALQQSPDLLGYRQCLTRIYNGEVDRWVNPDDDECHAALLAFGVHTGDSNLTTIAFGAIRSPASIYRAAAWSAKQGAVWAPRSVDGLVEASVRGDASFFEFEVAVAELDYAANACAPNESKELQEGGRVRAAYNKALHRIGSSYMDPVAAKQLLDTTLGQAGWKKRPLGGWHKELVEPPAYLTFKPPQQHVTELAAHLDNQDYTAARDTLVDLSRRPSNYENLASKIQALALIGGCATRERQQDATIVDRITTELRVIRDTRERGHQSGAEWERIAAQVEEIVDFRMYLAANQEIITLAAQDRWAVPEDVLEKVRDKTRRYGGTWWRMSGDNTELV